MKIAIIGAGLAGLSAAAALQRAGHDIVLFDKARGPGGRMSTRRVETAQDMAFFDHGAQYFTARDADFAAEVARWEAAGTAARWPAAGDDAWVGTPGMNGIIKALAAGHDVRWNCRIETIARDGTLWQLAHADGVETADAVIVAVPAEQVGDLVAAHQAEWAGLAQATRSQPCWTVMAAFDARVEFAADSLRNCGAIGWAARNSAKPGRSGPESWVVQGSPDWSAEHLEDDGDAVIARLLAELAEAVGEGLPGILAVQAHRWRYAMSGAAGKTALWDGSLRLGLCGDWLIGPRIENAWVSGRALAGLADPDRTGA
ncbi:NAD(P)/FAD-dependent oxidoreductase [Blastomonas sp.]|uniref:NAD(P)/FAD-dependent oxidoreductase n=1 Tax=Blastomonas sp. TaxID=1909299 RepID=UPI00260B91EC|nr:FAD-dependent oxidoreductase [Blastomonas sp.]MDM7957260.1 FAD-dependent oxidoreductase [Blastomonas sp.]